MRQLKEQLKQALASPPGWRFAARFLRKAGVTVLMYHRVTRPGDPFPGLDIALFEAQMKWLKRNCDVIGTAELLAACGQPRGRPPVLITFDDGYRDYHDNAYPVLRSLGLPAVVFVATSFIDEGGMIWTDRVHWAVQASPVERVVLPWDDSACALSRPGERARCIRACKEYLKDIPDVDRGRRLEELLDRLEVRDRETEVPRQMMSWPEVRATMPLTEYGGHSHTHPILSQLSPQAMAEEIRVCRERIARETGRAPTSFAYPNGRSVDFNEATKQLLRDHGFRLAFTTEEGINGADVDPLEICRLPTTGSTVGDFAWLVADLGVRS